MTPCFFGSGTRRLFGIYEPAHPGTTGRRAAVLCNPWGAEYIHAHRSLRHLALQLCTAGIHTLRFDYFGTGDSAGDMADGDLPSWEADIETAIEELRDMTGTPRIVLAGLRLGANLAAQVAARRSADVERLVMWTPIISGKAFVRDLGLDPVSIARTADASAGKTMEARGFILSADLRDQMRALDLAPWLAALAVPSLLLVSDGTAGPLGVRSLANATLETARIDPQTPWVDENSQIGALPVTTIHKITDWLS